MRIYDPVSAKTFPGIGNALMDYCHGKWCSEDCKIYDLWNSEFPKYNHCIPFATENPEAAINVMGMIDLDREYDGCYEVVDISEYI